MELETVCLMKGVSWARMRATRSPLLAPAEEEDVSVVTTRWTAGAMRRTTLPTRAALPVAPLLEEVVVVVWVRRAPKPPEVEPTLALVTWVRREPKPELVTPEVTIPLLPTLVLVVTVRDTVGLGKKMFFFL